MTGRPKNRGRSTATLLIGGGLLVAAGIFAWQRSSSTPPVTFRTVRVDRGAVEATVTATGALNAVVTVQVGSQVSGTILKLGADFNSKVTQGQVIAQIDPTRFRANLAQVEAALKSAEASLVRAEVNVRQAKVELERAKPLADKQVIGAAELDASRSKYDQAVADSASAAAQVAQSRASVGVARVDLERTTIKAPIDGTVLQRSVDVGQTVAASLQAPVLFTIAQDLSRMEVHAAIDEADVGKLREGQEATFTVDAYPGETFRGTIFQIRSQPTVTQNVVTYDAILRVGNEAGKLRPGMTASVRAVSQRHEGVLRLPNSALRFRPGADLIEKAAGGVAAGGGPDGGARAGGRPARAGGEGAGAPGGAGRWAKAYQARGDKVAAVRFKPGIADDEFTEIAAGNLHEGDEIVIDATGGAASGGPAGPVGGGNRGRGPKLF